MEKLKGSFGTTLKGSKKGRLPADFCGGMEEASSVMVGITGALRSRNDSIVMTEEDSTKNREYYRCLWI